MRPIIPTIIIVASLGAVFGFVNPRYEEVKVLQAERAQYQEALNNAQQLQKVRDSLLSTYNALPKNDLEKLKKLLPDHVDNVRLIIDISDIARRYGLSLKSVKNVETNKQNPNGPEIDLNQDLYGSAALNFSVSSPYSNFIAFLKDLEQSLRVVDIESLEFDTKEGSIYDFNLGIKTYWLK